MPTAAEKNVAFPVLTVLIAMQKKYQWKTESWLHTPLLFLAPFLYHNLRVKRDSLFIFRTSNCVVLDTFHTSLYSRGKHYSKSICDAHAHDQAGKKPRPQGPTLSRGWDLGRLGRVVTLRNVGLTLLFAFWWSCSCAVYRKCLPVLCSSRLATIARGR